MAQESYFEVHQIKRPDGFPDSSDFRMAELPMPTQKPGQALVKNLFLSVDPYMRECMDGEWELNAGLEGRSIGTVINTGNTGLKQGQLIFHREGWRSHALVKMDEVRVLPTLEGLSPSVYLSALGGTGLTAYVALTQIAKLKPGEDVFVSAAAGGVGSAVAQLARLMGVGRLIGSTGSEVKARYLTEVLGYDAAIDYSRGEMSEQLARAAPNGFDICIDNVGGEHLQAAINVIKEHGRITWVGAVSQYNSHERPSAPYNLYDVVGKSLRLEGFLVRNYGHLQTELEAFLVPHLYAQRVVPQQTVVSGLQNMASAFLNMLSGTNQGKMIVEVSS